MYALVNVDQPIIPPQRRFTKKVEAALTVLRVKFCEDAGLAEEALPLPVLRAFYMAHEEYARLRLQYPQATVFTDSVPWCLVEAYRRTYDGEALPDTASACMSGKGRAFVRAKRVAEEAGYVAHPAACAEACGAISYAMLRCEDLHHRQCWYRSRLTPQQWVPPVKYPVVDFNF